MEETENAETRLSEAATLLRVKYCKKDADGKPIATLDKWGEATTREIAGMATDRAGCLVCGLGSRGAILRIPLGEILRKK
jgi:hypothetical protein